METVKGTIVKYREEVMGEYADAWIEEYEETLDKMFEEMEIAPWALDEENLVCFFFDDCDDYEFAVPMGNDYYWTAYGIGWRNGQKLLLDRKASVE